ncbi:hypothetical protein M885DRAFT_521502 [Pelagophyceae sp. CCMP2097]|nr:hypothetical protein M885DRAFT_521502 [Pelagophyceae sp. CCMP2097]
MGLSSLSAGRPKDYVIYVKVYDVHGAVSSWIRSRSYLTLRATVRAADGAAVGAGARSAARVKNRVVHGADFTSWLPGDGAAESSPTADSPAAAADASPGAAGADGLDDDADGADDADDAAGDEYSAVDADSEYGTRLRLNARVDELEGHVLHLRVHERLAHGIRFHSLGHAEVSLSQVREIRGAKCVSGAAKAAAFVPGRADVRTLSIFTKSKLTLKNGSCRDNGTLRVAVWIALEETKPNWIFDVAVSNWRTLLAACLVANAVGLRCLLAWRLVAILRLVAPVCLLWLYLELPGFLGKAVTAVLAAAMPELGLSLGSLSLEARFFAPREAPGPAGSCASETGKPAASAGARSRDLMVNVRVTDFALANDPDAGYLHENFVAAKSVRLSLSFDMFDVGLALYRAAGRACANCAYLHAQEAEERARAPSETPPRARGDTPPRQRRFSVGARHEPLESRAAATHAILTLRGIDLAAKDHWITAPDSSDPFLRLMALPPASAAHEFAQKASTFGFLDRRSSAHETVSAWGDRHHIYEAELDAHVEVARTEVVPRCLQPSWNRVVVDLAQLEDKLRPTCTNHHHVEAGRLRAATVVGGDASPVRGSHALSTVFVCYDKNLDPYESTLIGATETVDLLRLNGRQPLHGDATAMDLDLCKKGKLGGVLRCSVQYVAVARDGAPQRGAPAVAWRAFPSEHAALREALMPRFQPTYLCALRVHECVVEGIDVSFDIARNTGEFNVNNFVRRLADGKVRTKLQGGRAPNTLTVRLVSAKALRYATKRRALYATLTVRGATERSVSAVVDDDSARWPDFAFPPVRVCDASAVIVVRVFEKQETTRCVVKKAMWKDTLVGQWMTTVKMLAVAPKNVRGEDLEPYTAIDGNDATFGLSGTMQLLDATWRQPAGAVALRLSWAHDAAGPTHEILLAQQRQTALEQLQANSAETALKVGDVELARQMLRDFPIRFDFRDLRLTKINFHLKALFMGFSGETASQKQAICIDAVDLRDRLACRRGEDGLDLACLSARLMRSAIGPVLAEVNFAYSLGTIASGALAGLASAWGAAPDGKPADGRPPAPDAEAAEKEE